MADKIKLEPVSKEELTEIVEELGNIRGRHTELVSVLVPSGSNINVVIDQLESEKSTARNIKSSTTRKNVIEALERATRQLRQLGQATPKNGIAIYSGNVSPIEGQEDMRIWAIVPPEELGMRLYRCDQVFILDALKEMLEIKEVYGLFVIERKEATIGLLEGKKIKILQHFDSAVPGKTRAGGQSSQRYERIIEGKAKDFYRECAEALKDHFFEMKNLKGIIIGGPMPTKDEFLKEGLLVTVLKNKIIGMKDIGYANEHGIDLLVEASGDLLKEQEIIKEKKLMEKFFDMLGKERKKTAYGVEEVNKALDLACVDTLLLSRKLDKEVSKGFQEKAEKTSAKVEFVSNETEEGQQFFNLGGVGAMLRFSL
ncbi:MAG: peptide chain release factor aRF-1 [archaeon]|nr:peptide chain release factor aRF-1 [archaeon]